MVSPRRRQSTQEPAFSTQEPAFSTQVQAESTARSGRKDTWREANQKQFFWEHEKAQPSKTFIIPCRAADPKADFPLEDLQSGRTDLACRAVSAAMFFSSGVRRDVKVVLLLGSETAEEGGEGRQGSKAVKTRAVWINGEHVRHLRPDERNIACVLQTVQKRSLWR